MADFELIRVLLVLAMFVSASYFDLKKRSVKDLLWIGFAVAAVVVYIFDFPTSYSEGILILISMGFTAAVSYGAYKLGFFGGADMLALITLSGILPTYDGSFAWQTLTFHPIAPIIVLTNALILSMSQLVFNVARNLAYSSRHPGKLFEGLEHEPTSKKIFAAILGHRSENPQYAFPIEKTVNGRREFDFALKPAETTEYESRHDVWVMPGMPFLLYLAAGFITMIAGGDLLILILRLFI